MGFLLSEIKLDIHASLLYDEGITGFKFVFA